MKTFNHFVNIHAGKKAIVMGLGVSTNSIIGMDLSDVITIGVNDIDKVYSPKYALTLDSPQRLGPERSAYLKKTNA